MYKTKTIHDIKEDFIDTQSISLEITDEIVNKTTLMQRIMQELLKFFSPMM